MKTSVRGPHHGLTGPLPPVLDATMVHTVRLASFAAALACSVPGAAAIEPGWHYSPLPGEGDRASLGCDSKASEAAFTCLAVRCEDDFSTGLYIHASTPPAGATRWDMTIDRENIVLETTPSSAPYAARVTGDPAPLLERLEQGTFVYLRPLDGQAETYAFIDLRGSLTAIREALYWCAPKAAVTEQNDAPGVVPQTDNGEMR